MLREYFPLYGLRLTTPRLELRLPSERELGELASLAAKGIHDPAVMPFLSSWTDGEPAEVARSVVQFHWSALGRWRPDDWTLNLTVFHDGVVVGSQGLSARDFAVVREVGTGSWLGERHQGQGIGREMRAAVLALAFEGLGALEATSGAFADNTRSLSVSRGLGYRDDGINRRVVRGEAAVEQRLRLSREAWESHRTIPVEIEGLGECLPQFGVAGE